MRAGLTPTRLTRAGAELADREGLEALTVSALARQFAVRPASLYSHVASTGDLRVRVALLALEELADRVAIAIAGLAAGDALTALADAHRDYAREHPGRYAATLTRLDADTAMTSAGPRHAAMSRAVLRGYALSEAEQPHAVRLVGSFVRGFLDLEHSGGFDHSTPSSDDSWRRGLAALDHTLRHWEAAR